VTRTSRQKYNTRILQGRGVIQVCPARGTAGDGSGPGQVGKKGKYIEVLDYFFVIYFVVSNVEEQKSCWVMEFILLC